MCKQLSVAVLALVAMTTFAVAQSGDVEILTSQLKSARVVAIGPPPPPRTNTIVLPPGEAGTQPRFGYRLIMGGLYEPSAFPDETWITIACLSSDPRVVYDDAQFGFSLVRVHALIFELDADGSLNTDTPLSTVDTTESDEAICDLSRGVDASFIEIPRTFKAGAVTLFSVGRPNQHVDVTEQVERAVAVF